jgi:fructose-bisphosphate aldolase class II
MPIVSIFKEMKKAQAGHYCIPLFDTFDTHTTEGILAAAVAKQAPVIVGVYSGLFDRPIAAPFMAYLKAMAAQTPVPVSLMLDHGSSFENCMKAIALGCSDVMYDGSRLPVEENIATTKLVVRAAHAVGVSVEAELGHVGQGSEYQSFGMQRKGFTDPAQVERFVAESGVDTLAVAIGSAHGKFQGEPHLALDLLAEIRKRTDTPLVVHGGSGLTEEQFRGAVAGGVCKINIFTDLATTAVDYMAEELKKKDANFNGVTGRIVEAFKVRCEYHLDLFSTTGHAKS